MSTNRTQPEYLPQLTIKSVRNEFSEILIVNFDPVENARAYEVRYKLGNGEWVSAGVFGYSRNIVIPNLTRGEEYTVQGRAVGGKSGYGAWSDSVARIIT